MIIDQVVLIKLLIAFGFGCVLGLERTFKRKSASLKTAIVLTVASCMVTIVSIESASIFSSPYDMPMDPLRLAAQLISGISFIGAGIILTKNNDAVSGLTTAALMWASVGFGISIGAGFYIEATFALILIIFGVEFLPTIIKWIGPRMLKEQQLKLKIKVQDTDEMTRILKEMKEKEIKIYKVKIRTFEDHPRMDCLAAVNEKKYITEVYKNLKEIKGVINIEIESF